MSNILYGIVDRIDYSTPANQIEVFFSKKYNRNYHFRAQINFIYEDEILEKREYCLMIIFLVHDKYSINENLINVDFNKFGEFGKIYGKTKKQYISIVRKHLKNQCTGLEMNKEKTEEFMDEAIRQNNKPLEIKKDISALRTLIATNETIKKFVRREKKIILCDIDIIPIDAKASGSNQIFKLFAKYFSKNKISNLHGDSDVRETFNLLLKIRNRTYYIEELSSDSYYKLIRKISNLVYEWTQGKKVDGKYLEKLNSFITNYGEYLKGKESILDESKFAYDPLIHFCYKFFNSLLKELKNEKKIMTCHGVKCAHIFEYKTGKKFCNAREDGRNCDEKDENKDLVTKDDLKRILKNYGINTPISLDKAFLLANELYNERNNLVKGYFVEKKRNKASDKSIEALYREIERELEIGKGSIKNFLHPKKSQK